MDVYDIELSDDYKWNKIVTHYKNKILRCIYKIRPLYEQYISYAHIALRTYQILGGTILYQKEIEQISMILGIPFVECLLIQLVYEANAACTSAILKSEEEYVHVRTMDWDLNELKSITIRIKVFDKGIHVFDAITWAGFVGIFTGIKHNKYTISLNYRRNPHPNILENANMMISGAYPNAYFIRELLSSNKDPLLAIKEVELIAPAYYIIMSEDFSGVITRKCSGYSIEYDYPCIQTNCSDIGIGDNILYSYERIEYMNKILYSNLSNIDLIDYIDKFPVKNEETIYTVIMNLEQFLYISY